MPLPNIFSRNYFVKTLKYINPKEKSNIEIYLQFPNKIQTRNLWLFIFFLFQKWNFLSHIGPRVKCTPTYIPTYYNRIGENLLGQKILLYYTLSNAIAKLFIAKWHGSIRFFVHWRFIYWNGRGFFLLVCRFWSFIFCWGMVLIMWGNIFLMIVSVIVVKKHLTVSAKIIPPG